MKKIKELLDKKNHDQFIHCIWYCFNGIDL